MIGVVQWPAMEPPPRPVLPYATPTSLRRIRKPLRTEIVTDPKLPYINYIEQSAEQKPNVVLAIAFALLTAILIGTMAWWEWRRHAGPRLGQALFLTTFCLGQITAILYVIQVVWTRTSLSVQHGELWLDVQTLVGTHAKRWESDQVDGIEAWTTDEGDRLLEPLAELHVRPRSGVTVKLMRNYSRAQLVPIAAAFERELRQGLVPPAHHET